jgi:ABC-type uncharacterized transport system involved in gliding motility auxiliary subunit
MQNNTPFYNRYSWLIAALGLVSLLVGLVILVLLPEIRTGAWGILALGVLLIATAFIIDFRRLRSAVTGRRGMFSTGTTVMVSVFVGITLLINAISISNYHQFDVTGVAQFLITSKTKSVLEEMNMPVKALCFFVPDDPYGIASYARILLAEYQKYTDILSVEEIDPDEHPEKAREYDVTQYPAVVFESELGRRMVLPEDFIEQPEHFFTSAVLEVTGIVQKKVYFLTGHDESDIDGEYAYAKQGLLDNLYKVDTVDLMLTYTVPEDCSALIISAPQKSLTSDELAIINEYLENDGWLLVLLNPDSPEEIKQLLSNWWIEIENGTVIDAQSHLASSDDAHNMEKVIVPRIRNEFALPEVYFPGATSIMPRNDNPDDIVLLPLIYTSLFSWMEEGLDPLVKPEFDVETEMLGSRAISVLAYMYLPEDAEEVPEGFKLTRLIVMGDSDFASNQHFYNGDNGDLFLNTVELLTQGKELITIERKVLPFRRMLIGPEEETFIRISSIGLLPLLVLIAGGIVWWRRR